MNTAGKIKRIRNNGHVLLAPCDRTGQTILGKEIEAHAHLLSKSEFEQAHASLAAKYGEQFTGITTRALPAPIWKECISQLSLHKGVHYHE